MQSVSLPLWFQLAAAVAAVVWPVGLYIGRKMDRIDTLLEAELPTRVAILETKVAMWKRSA